ncbi:hypothetical protein LIA77_07617 [Sarocladium implicatum]|nr:hypothetical protein LIA77_07617 [Sarocladium implicatum]
MDILFWGVFEALRFSEMSGKGKKSCTPTAWGCLWLMSQTGSSCALQTRPTFHCLGEVQSAHTSFVNKANYS